MYVVKSLKLHGFKTFPKETVIHFEKGITAITGPNGSGKSNIAEALIWVMGEQSPSTFRSGQMEDVIFAGTDKLPPLGMAEVVLKFEKLNPSKGEDRYVEILRRFYREGEGEYRLNGKRVRRKDIQEFLYDIGLGSKSFALIEQGKITQIIEAKPEERRVFIEEVAGILKYKLKKKEAESKIRLTKDNLERVEDIIAEVRKNLNSLRQQAARARQFKKLQEELNGIEKKIVAHRIFLIEEELNGLAEEVNRFEDSLVSLSSEISSINAEIESKKSEVIERENDIALLNKDYFEKKLKSERLEAEIRNKSELLEDLRKRIANYAEEIEFLEKEGLDLDSKAEKERENLSLAREDLETLNIKAETMGGKLSSLKDELKEKEKEFFDIELQLKEGEREHYKTVSDLNYAKKEKVSILNELEERKKLLETVKKEIEEFEKKRDLSLKEVEELELSLKELRDLRDELTFRLEEVNSRIKSREGELNQLTVEINTLKNRDAQIRGFLENREGFSEDVKRLMREKKELILGVIGDFVEVKDSDVNFFDNFFNSYYQVIVPRDYEGFKKLVEYCRDKNLKGIGILCPLEKEKKNEISDNKNLFDFLSFEGKIPLNFIEFLKKFSVFSSFDSPEKDAVFLNGDFYSSESGIYRTGSKDESGFLGLKGQLKKISAKLENLSAKKETLKDELATLNSEKEDVERELTRLNGEIEDLTETLSGKKTELEKHSHIVSLKEQERIRVEREVESLKENADSIEKSIQALSEKIESFEKEIEEKRQLKEEKSYKLNTLKEELEYLQEEHNDLLLMVEKRKSTVQSIKKELDFIERKKKEIAYRIEKAKKDREKDTETVANLEKEIENLKTNADNIVDAYRQISSVLNEKKEILEGKKKELALLEKKVFELKKKEEEIVRLKQEKEIKKAEKTVKFNDLKDYQISKFGKFESEKTENYEELNLQFEKLSRKLENFGAINLLAIEECDEQEKRYNFLMEQKKDLEKSIKTLTRDIKEIDETTKTLFTNAFDFINKKFGEIFQELFGGGKAYLKLSDEENVLDSGVEVYAKVPGETIKRISLLSGGEKAKTALALVFALFEYRVAPLCVLDEVDAPLDEPSVYRFGQFLKRYRDRVQFIVITHNKVTMELADYLYGVTMEEPGCSKVFTAKLQDFS